MAQLNHKHLYYFYVVAKEGSVKAAAESLNVSQPTVSDQVKLLEESLQVQLFERRNRGLYLTKQGQYCLKSAEYIFDLSNKLSSELRSGSVKKEGELKIGITPYMSQYYDYQSLLPLFDQNRSKVFIKEGQREALLAELESEDLDLVITNDRDYLAGGFEAHPMGINRTFAVAHKKIVSKDFKFPQGLADLDFFGYSQDSKLRFEIDLFFTKSGISPRWIGEADDYDIQRMITTAGFAFIIVPEAAFSKFKDDQLLVLGELKELQTRVWGLSKSSPSSEIKKFLEEH